MPKTKITIKPNNHRIHPCQSDKKIPLINEIISKNTDKKIVVVSSDSNDMLKEHIDFKNVSMLSDKELITDKDIVFEYLISYDLPDMAIVYMARVAKATQMAVVLLDESEYKRLYPIETLLGRTLKQEVITGYEPKTVEKKVQDKTKPKKMNKEKIKEVAKKRYDLKTKAKPKKDFELNDKSQTPDKWKKKKKAPNKYLGKDENGKAIFSGKTGDRNHKYDGTPKDKYESVKKVGKKIKIKSRKK